MQHYTATSVRSFAGHRPLFGQRVLVDPSAVALGDVELGGSVLHITHAGPYNPEGWPLLIGAEVTIGHNATLHGCSIGNRVLVGMGATVMDGAVVEDQVVIGACALVTPGKTLRSGYLYAGSPAREVRPLSAAERDYFSYSADNYVRLKDRHLAELEPAG